MRKFVGILGLAVVIGIAGIFLFMVTVQADSYSKIHNCGRKLSKIYVACAMYADMELNKGGGDGLYPNLSVDAPEKAYQNFYDVGILKKVEQVQCPAYQKAPVPSTSYVYSCKKCKNRGYMVKKEKEKFYAICSKCKGKQPYKIVTKKVAKKKSKKGKKVVLTNENCHYSWSNTKLGSEDEEKDICIASDRWCRDKGYGPVQNNHLGGFNVLVSTGRIRFCKVNTALLKHFLKQLYRGMKAKKKETSTGKK